MNSSIKKYSLRYAIEWLLSRNISKKFSDKTYVRLMYFAETGGFLKLNHPESFNEKLQWIKVFDHNPMYTEIADKLKVKEYISKKIGIEYVIPTLGVWDSFEEIDFDTLPDSFVLKCNHDSGGVIICKDKSRFDFESARKKINHCMKRNYYWSGREWPYKNIVPKIMAEELLIDESGVELKDYKFFCFNGKPQFFKVDFDRFIDHHANYYNLDMTQLDYGEIICPPVYDRIIKKPENFDRMVTLAEELSKGFDFLRVDFYNIAGKIYFGELTLFPASGAGPFIDPKTDINIGKLLRLSKRVGKRNAR